MKYRKILTIEDKYILDKTSGELIAKMMGCDPSYISLLRSGKRVASEKFYKRLVEVLTGL